MRIGIDAQFFGPKDRGLGRYTQKLIENLRNIDRVNQYFIFSKKLSFLRRQIFLPLQIRKYNLDLMHFTYFNVPIFYRGKFIVTIHDLNFSNVGFFKRLIYGIVLKSALKRAEKIIAISEFTKNGILKHYKINSDKIRVIHEGVSGETGSRPQNPKPYILYVGNDYAHKNLQRLKLAFAQIKKEYPEYELILIINFVSEQELDNLYRNASLFVFPSLYEGFGLPPLEAMQRGVPVVSSNASCMPEILGNAVIYFDPLDINDMAEKIKKVLADKNLREQLIQKGFVQVKKYSWQKMAEETRNIYITLN
jgi:glycosyltransferase involved in cell wall biosynthesis